MNAAMRLSDIFLTADQRAEKQADRAYRAALRAQGVSVTEPNETETAVPETAEQAAARFLQSVGHGVTTNE
jgi:hypothetical protein